MSGVVEKTVENPAWLSIPEACDYLKISEQTLFRWMRTGKVSFYKVGKSTRFKKEILDLAVEKVVGKPEGEVLSERCAVCGHSRLIEGKVTSTGNIYFKPAKTKFLVWSDSTVQVRARCCPACGHIQMRADTAKLNRLLSRQEQERQTGEEASEPEE
jgi:excisionase family DNA binding protein